MQTTAGELDSAGSTGDPPEQLPLRPTLPDASSAPRRVCTTVGLFSTPFAVPMHLVTLLSYLFQDG